MSDTGEDKKRARSPSSSSSEELNPIVQRMDESDPNPIYQDNPSNTNRPNPNNTNRDNAVTPRDEPPSVPPVQRPTGTIPRNTNPSTRQPTLRLPTHPPPTNPSLMDPIREMQRELRRVDDLQGRLNEALARLQLQESQARTARPPPTDPVFRPFAQHVLDPMFDALPEEHLQEFMDSLDQADTSDDPNSAEWVERIRAHVQGRLPDQQNDRDPDPDRQHDLHHFLGDYDYDQLLHAPQNSWKIDAQARQAKTTKAKVSSATMRNPRLQDLTSELKETLDQITLRETLKSLPGASASIKRHLDQDIANLTSRLESTSEAVKDITQIIDDRTKELPVPKDYSHSGADLYKIRKLLQGIKNTERILRLVAKEADTFRLSHEEVKELLALSLPDEPYKTFEANKDYPLAVIYKLLSDQFIDQTSPYVKVSDIDSFSFHPKETLRAGLVRLDTLISETNSLFPLDERVGRRARLKQETLFRAIPDKVRDKLELNKVRALRRGTFYQFEDMLDDAEDILTSMRMPLMPSKNSTVSLKNIQVNNAGLPKKRKMFDGKAKPAGNNNNNRMKKYSRHFQKGTNKQGRLVYTRRNSNNNQQQQYRRQQQQQHQQPPRRYNNNQGRPQQQPRQYQQRYNNNYNQGYSNQQRAPSGTPYYSSQPNQKRNWYPNRNQQYNTQRFAAKGDHVMHQWNARTKDHLVVTSDQPINMRRHQQGNQGRNYNSNQNQRRYYANNSQVRSDSNQAQNPPMLAIEQEN